MLENLGIKMRYIGTDLTQAPGKIYYCRFESAGNLLTSSRIKIIREDPEIDAIFPPIIYSSWYDLFKEWEVVL